MEVLLLVLFLDCVTAAAFGSLWFLCRLILGAGANLPDSAIRLLYHGDREKQRRDLQRNEDFPSKLLWLGLIMIAAITVLVPCVCILV